MDRSRFTTYIVIITLITGYIYFTNYALIEEPKHVQNTICNTSCGNIIRKECYDDGRIYYTCYDVEIIFKISIDGKEYTRNRTHKYRDYQTLCNNTYTLCTYDDRMIY